MTPERIYDAIKAMNWHANRLRFESTRFIMPTGLSTNALYWNVTPKMGNIAKGKMKRSRVPTDKYREWKSQTASILMLQRRTATPNEPWDGTIGLFFSVDKKHPRADISNKLKSMEDALVDNHYLTDDRQVKFVAIGEMEMMYGKNQSNYAKLYGFDTEHWPEVASWTMVTMVKFHDG